MFFFYRYRHTFWNSIELGFPVVEAGDRIGLVSTKILDVYFTPKVYQYFNPKVYHFNLISKSVSLLGAVPPPTGKRAFLF
jgi:hypothetical protein